MINGEGEKLWLEQPSTGYQLWLGRRISGAERLDLRGKAYQALQSAALLCRSTQSQVYVVECGSFMAGVTTRPAVGRQKVLFMVDTVGSVWSVRTVGALNR